MPEIKITEKIKLDFHHTMCDLPTGLKYLCEEFLGYRDWDLVHDEVQAMLERKSRRKAILLPRNHLKTSIVTVGKTIQYMLKNKNVRILLANQVWDRARDMLGEIRGQLENSNLKYIYGDFVSDRWNSDGITIKQRKKQFKEPTVMTTGVEAETTGGHFDVIFLDDLMGLQNSQTSEQREKAKRFRRSMVNLLEPNGILIEVGTRWHLDDTFSDLLENEKEYYDVMIRQVVEDGKIIFPKKFSKTWNPETKTWVPDPTGKAMDFINYLKKTLTRFDFAAQYMNNPVDEEHQLFKKHMFKYFGKRPEALYVSMAVDFAASLEDTADKTAIVVCGMDKDWNIYLLDYLQGRWTPAQIVDNLFKMQSQWKPFRCGVEVNGFQRVLKLGVEQEMRNRKQFFGIEEIRNGPKQSKTNRISSLEPFYRDGKVFHMEHMRGKEMEDQLLAFPRGKHDDLIDAMAMILPMLSPGIEHDQQKVPEGSWEWAFRNARAQNMNYRGFFGGIRGL